MNKLISILKINISMNNSFYSFNLNTSHKITTNLLKSFFSSSLNKGSVLISEPTFKISNNTIIVQVFYYISPRLSYLPDTSKNILSIAISKLYPNINVELQLVQQYQPYINASILAQYLAINASKYGFHRIINILLSNVPFYNPNITIISDNNIVTVCIIGLKIQLSGLLTTQRNRARKTVYTASAGTFHSNNQKINIDYAQSTSKTREGAFNIKVWISSISNS